MSAIAWMRAGLARGRAVSAIAALIAALAAAGGQAWPQGTEVVVSGRNLLIPPPSGQARFRFLPSGEWAAFDRTLVLSAAEREERSYQLEVQSGDGQGSVTSYRIDKRPPEAPSAKPAGGLYREALTPTLSAAEGTRIFWTLIGDAAEGQAGFRAYDAGSLPSIALPAAGSALYTLIAYAEDRAGNRSLPARFVYRLADASLPAMAPAADRAPAAPIAAPEIPAPELVTDRGSAVIMAKVQTGKSLLVAVNPGQSPRPEDFAEAVTEGPVSRFSLDCPYGWAGTLNVFYGYRGQDGAILYNPKPLSVALSNPTEAPTAPPPPPAPRLIADPIGRGAFVGFPSYGGEIVAALDDGPEQAYHGPLAVAPGKTRLTVSWYGVDGSGNRSMRRSLGFDLPPPIPEVSLRGAEEGAVLGADASISPTGTATIRYELSYDGSVPNEPDGSSRLLGPSLAIACPPGEARSIVLRYRAFSGPGSEDTGGEGRILRFSIDKRPPSVPSLTESQPAFSDRERSLRLGSDAGASVYVSVSTGSETAPFRLASGPIELVGSDDGPIRYTLRAYAVSRAGIRSAEMAPLVLTVDLNSIYVSDAAPAGGDGSPDRPFSDLDAALALASASGKRRVNLMGRFQLHKAFAAE
ncbi:MAG TPA: hypothetical protein VFL04_02940, partial [Rectinemataceae bacterium]|nr:hypothetical protein [Rectinemataceae bacterium]